VPGGGAEERCVLPDDVAPVRLQRPDLFLQFRRLAVHATVPEYAARGGVHVQLEPQLLLRFQPLLLRRRRLALLMKKCSETLFRVQDT
jgi:hypothetical protein